MNFARVLVCVAVVIALHGCKKEENLPVPNITNGDFESWTSVDELQGWKSNSCPTCSPDFQTYVIQKTTEAYHGRYAAKIVYNGVFCATASTKLAIATHPDNLTGFVKCQLNPGDSVSIKVRVYSNNTVVDSGRWVNRESISAYKQIVIPVSHSSTHADSVKVSVRGGTIRGDNGNGSVMWVDYFSFH